MTAVLLILAGFTIGWVYKRHDELVWIHRHKELARNCEARLGFNPDVPVEHWPKEHGGPRIAQGGLQWRYEANRARPSRNEADAARAFALIANAPCPTCGAKSYEPCVTPIGPTWVYHSERGSAARSP